MRYAVNGNIEIKKTNEYDVVIIGAGLAGLYTALNLDKNLSCLIIAKDNFETSNSWLAQAGIAAAISVDDHPDLHLEDTVVAGAGLSDIEAVKILAGEGPSDIKNLVSLGIPFDFDEDGKLNLTLEGGHKKRRVVHAGGDATGRQTVISLAGIVARLDNVSSRGHYCLFDILTDSNGVIGVIVKNSNGDYLLIKTGNVVIATGGIGQVYKSTTNPSVATGDGIAAAKRAGAVLRDIEFIQFHPTGLWNKNNDTREFLISESLRGEGAKLVNSVGERFMIGKHPLAELAPRDIVARGIVKEMQREKSECVFLDITSEPEDYLKERFPTIFNECLKHGINMAKDRIPVHPVQHYLMGGIKTDFNGQTNISGLYACGEAASTGIHGANRLAANSLLECLVFGRRTAEKINMKKSDKKSYTFDSLEIPIKQNTKLDFDGMRNEIQKLMNDNCGVIRKKSDLEHALNRVKQIYIELDEVFDDSINYLETLNIAAIAKEILEAAYKRPNSIGSHYLDDECE